jgi:hypothetical protein
MTRSRFLGAAFAAAALSALLPSCATSSGSAYSSAASSESAAARAAKPDRPEAPEPAPREEGGGLVFSFGDQEPAPEPTGSLVLENLAPGSSIYIDGGYSSGTPIRLSPGYHELRISRFGYRDFEATVLISLDAAATERVEYEGAPFAIRDLDLEPRAFDPADPGYLGSCEARLLVSAPGSGSASVVDARGAAVRSLGSLDFGGPSLRLRWDGRGDGGKRLPPGEYLLRVEGRGAGGEGDSAEARVSLASGVYSRSAIMYSGLSGALFAPDARSLAPGKLETAAGAELHLSPQGATMSGLGTVHAGLRAGLPSSSGLSELDASVMGVLWQDDPYADSYSITGAWKHSLGGAPLAAPGAAAIYVKGTVARFFSGDPESSVSPSWDGTTRYTGLSVGLPLEYATGSVRAFAAPELEVSDYYPNWTAPGARWDTPGFFAWAYLRLGLEATAGRYSIAVSGALRSAPFGGEFELAGPTPIGLEIRWHAPSTPLVLSFIATGEIESLSSYWIGAGIGVGFRY